MPKQTSGINNFIPGINLFTESPSNVLPLWKAIWLGRFQEEPFFYDFVGKIFYFHLVHLWEGPEQWPNNNNNKEKNPHRFKQMMNDYYKDFLNIKAANKALIF